MRMRIIFVIMNFYDAILLPSKNCPLNILIRLIEFLLKQQLLVFKTCTAHNIRHYEFIWCHLVAL